MHKLNYEQLNFAYLPRSAVFYGVRHTETRSRIKEGIKSGKYDKWLFKEPRQPSKEEFLLCAGRHMELYILLELQGGFGIPELIGFAEVKLNEDSEWDPKRLYFERKQYSTEPPKHLSVTDMAIQLLRALEVVHRSGVVHTYLYSTNTIQWDNDEIKIVNWNSAMFHADIDAGYGSWKDGQKQQPLYDMICAGRIIKGWMAQFGSDPNDKELETLVEVLTRPEPSMRLSASHAVEALRTGVYKAPSIPETFDYELLSDCYNDSKLSKEVDQHSYQLLSKIKEKRLKDIIKSSSGVKWKQSVNRSYHRNRKKTTIPRMLFGELDGRKLCGKILVGLPLTKFNKDSAWGSSPFDMTALIPHEFYVTQMMSGKKHFPTLLSYEMFCCEDCTGVVMTMPRYRQKPHEKNVIRLAIELLTALQTLHSYGLMHGDIAPLNVMWDDDDTLILIDYDCVQHIKRGCGTDVYHMIGQKGFVSPDRLKTFFADVFSAGKLIEYYANRWKQQNKKISALVDEMTKEKWHERLSVNEALNRWNGFG